MDYMEAKKLFFEYGGSKFGMWHERVIEKYESFNVPKELERQWEEEVLNKLNQKMEMDCTPRQKRVIIQNYFHKNREFNQKDSINFLKKNREKLKDMDDFSKLIVIELIFDLSLPEEPKKRKPVVEKCIEKLNKMLEQEANGEFVIDEAYYEQGQIPDYLANGKLRERIKHIMDEFLEERVNIK